MGVWIIAGVVLILALLVRWRHALRGWVAFGQPVDWGCCAWCKL